MPGPNGETCGTCYYFQEDVLPDGTCRFDNVEPFLDSRSGNSPGWYPTTNADTGWCGNWLERTSVTAGFTATGAFVTPTETTFSVTDAVNWTKYDPGNLLDGAIMDNVTLTNGVLAWDIPGTPPPGSTWKVFISVFGSVLFPTASTFLEITVGTAGVPFSPNIVQRLQVNPTSDNLSLPWSLQGLAPANQTGSLELLMRGDIGLGIYTSNAMQINVERRS